MAETWATSGLDLHLDLTGPRRARRRSRPRSARRCATGGCRPAPGCRRRARWPPTSGSRATPSPTPTASSSPRAGSTARRGSGTRVAERAPAARPRRHRPRARPARPRLRPAPGLARPVGVPAVGLARRGPPRARRRAVRGARLRRPARPRRSCGARSPTTSPAPAACRATPDRIVVCSGFTQGLALLCQALRARGARTLAVEAYGQPPHRDVAIAAGLDVRAAARRRRRRRRRRSSATPTRRCSPRPTSSRSACRSHRASAHRGRRVGAATPAAS